MASSGLVELDRSLWQIYEVGKIKDVEVDKNTIESFVAALFRRATRCVAVSRTQAELCCTRLFGSTNGAPPSILDFLRIQDYHTNKSLGTLVFLVLDQLLNFLKDVYERLRHTIGMHAVTIVETSLLLISLISLPSKCRSAACDIAKYVIKHFDIPVYKFNILSQAEKLMSDLKSSKATQTVKGGILELFGEMLRKYPTELTSIRESIRVWIETSLEKQFSSNSPEMQIISGCFVCLTEILNGETYEQRKRDTLYTFMHKTLATAVSGNISRMGIVKSCLLLLGKHTELFANNIIGSDPYQFYSLILFCCSSTNKTIRKPAFACLDNVFAILATGLTSDIPMNKKHFNRFLKEFLTCLTDKLSDDKASIALTGLGNFARIIPQFMGDNATPKIFSRLTKYGEDLMAMRDGPRFKWVLLCRYVICYGRFLEQKKSGDPDIDTFCSSMLTRILEKYPWTAIYIKYQAELAVVAMMKANLNSIFIDRLTYQGMLLTVSTQMDATEMDVLYNPDTGFPETRLLFEFEILWKNVFKRIKDESLRKLFVDGMMKAILQIMDQLDLRYHVNDDSEGDSMVEIQPLVPRDHTIILNLTEFCERWLPFHIPYVRSWIPLLIQSILVKSRDLPMVSAFYRLGTLVSNDLNVEMSMDGHLLNDYIAYIQQVIASMKQYRDELLIATTQFVLATPLSLIDIDQLFPALKQALVLGISHEPTSIVALEAFKRWKCDASTRLIQEYPNFLALFSPYLNISMGVTAFQRELLRLLGSLGGYCKYVVEERQPDLQNHTILEFSLSMKDISVDISLGELMHQLKDAALHSTDRTLKTAASECFHGIVVYLCGMTATLPRSKYSSNKKSIYYDHWHHIFPTLLSLADDADTVTRTLFSNLLAQLIRWFSGISSLYPFEAQSFLDALISGLVNEDNGGMRDLSARSLSLFLKYAGKQSSSSMFSAHSLFERLFTLSSHPRISHRLGVALAVRHMYRDFREDDEMVNIFSLSITKHLLLSLKIEREGNLTSIHQALTHMKKIVVKCASLLEPENDNRVTLGGPECLHLASFAEWLLSKISSACHSFRKSCLDIFMTISRLVGLTGSCKEWINQYQKRHHVSKLVDILVPQELATYCFDQTMTTIWYDKLAASCECCVWACSPTYGNQSLIPDSILFESIGSLKRGREETGELPHENLIIAAMLQFFKRRDGPSNARNRAFAGICSLLVLALEHPSIVPTLRGKLDESLLVDPELYWYIIMSRLDPKLDGIHTAIDETVWIHLSKLLVHLPNQMYRLALQRELIQCQSYEWQHILTMESGLAIRVCSILQDLKQVGYWENGSNQVLADGLATLTIEKRKESNISPVQERILFAAHHAAIDLGWDFVRFILDDPQAHYNMFSTVYERVLQDQSTLLRLAQCLLQSATMNPNGIPTLVRTIEASKGTGKSLESLLDGFSRLTFEASSENQPILLRALVSLLESITTLKSPVHDMAHGINNILRDSSKSASLKANILQLIPQVLRLQPDSSNSLRESLEHLVIHDFPLSSSDIVRESLDFEAFQMLFQAYLDVLARSNHVGILSTLFRSLKEEKDHIFYNEILDALDLFCQSTDPSLGHAICMEVLSIVFDSIHNHYIHKILLRRVFQPFIKRLDEATITKIYTSQFQGTSVVTYLMNRITTDQSLNEQMVLSFGALETLYNCVSADAIRQTINTVYAPPPAKGNELTMRLCKTASQKCTSADPSCAQSAYRALLMTVRKTQSQEKFYTQLLFADAIWTNIMDPSVVYEFETQPSAFSTKYLSMRSNRSKKSNLRRIPVSTQFLQGSSLSQTVSNEVMTESSSTENEDDESLEMDILNSHPCMYPLMQTIKQMESLFQSQWQSATMPAWIDKVWFHLSTNSSLSVRLFMCKIVLNRPLNFQLFADKFVSPMTELMLQVPNANEFHYLLRDVSHLIIDTWNVQTVSCDLSEFLKRLIEVSPNSSTSVLRDNLYLIEAFLTRFPNQCRFLDMDVIINLISTAGISINEACRQVAGMQIVAILIQMTFITPSTSSPFEYLVRSCCSKLQTALLLQLASTHKSTPQLAADIAGMLLKHMYSAGFQSSIEEQLKTEFQGESPLRFLILLKQISSQYSQIVDASVLNRLFSIMPRILIQDTMTLHALDILHAACSIHSDIFRFIRPFLARFLRHTNRDVSEKLLDILIALYPTLSETNQRELLSGDDSILRAFDAKDCHLKLLDFLIASDKLEIEEVQIMLLKALIHPNDQVRQKAIQCWENKLPAACGERLLSLFGSLYHKDISQEWVRYAPSLWLSICSTQVDNSQLLFSAPLSTTCTFEELQVDTSWERRTQHVSTPLFSQEAQVLQSQPMEKYEAGLLKATQDRVWSQTQSQVSLTQGSTTQAREVKRAQTTARFTKSQDLSHDDQVTRDKQFFQDRASRIKRFEMARMLQEKATGTSISLYREYRVGELPDIQIPKLDILRPLLVVASLHASISTSLFSSVLSSTVPKLQITTQSHIYLNIEDLLQKSQHNSIFISCLHDVYLELLKHSTAKLLSPDVIGISTISSQNYASGQRILEEILVRAQDPSIQSMTQNQLHHVLQMEHNDIFLLTLSSQTSSLDQTKLAIEAQLKGDIVAALQHYQTAEKIFSEQTDRTSDSILERQRCKSEQYQCLAVLNKWNELLEEVELKDLWQQPEPFLEKHTRHYLEALVANRDVDLLEELVKVIENEQEKLAYVSQRFPDLVCGIYLEANQIGKAQAFIEQFYDECLDQWASLPPLAQQSLLDRLPNVVFMEDILQVLQQRENAMQCLLKWKTITPLIKENTLKTWSIFNLIRNLGYGKLIDSVDQQLHLKNEISGVQVHTMLCYAESAVNANVLALGGRLLSEYRRICTEANLPKLTVHMVQVYTAQVSKLAARQLQSAVDKSGDAREKTLQQVENFYTSLMRLFDNEEVLEYIPTLCKTTQADIYGLQACAFKEAADFHRLYRNPAYAAKMEAAALEIFETQSHELKHEIKQIHYDYIIFLDKCIEQTPSQIHLVQSFITVVLQGMTLADRSCAAYFPRVLGLLKENPSLIPYFDNMMQQVPIWTCLHWSAQILAQLDPEPTVFGTSILSLIEKMASEYPNALYYDYRLSRESNQYIETSPRFHKLSSLLRNELLDQFVAALEGLHHPEIRLKEALRYLTDVIESKSTREEKSKIIAATMASLFDQPRLLLGTQIGAYNRQWLKQHQGNIEKILGKDGTLASKATIQSARGWLSQSFQVMPGKHGIDRQWRAKLGDFSDWLSNLDSSQCKIELPGQYTQHWCKPDPSTHAYILSCESQLMVLPSKQLPKRMTIYGSNEQSYRFLVKGGEDLRLDQRIEQLFEVMNTVLHDHPQCRRRGLHTRTYKVIPMTRKIGLVEWLDDTTTLKSIIEEEMNGEKKKKVNLLQSLPGQQYETFWTKQKGKTYGHKVATAATTQVVDAFTHSQSLVPVDMLRRHLVRMGKSPQSFFQLRETFSTSLAAFNGCSYLLGIGDRHLDNFLLDQKTGAVIGIDFGISFGAGASLLPVPELVPFRFTRQLEGVLQPYNALVHLEQDLSAVLEAVRAQEQRIDSIMRVFLNEPLLEWQVPVKKSQMIEDEGSLNETTWMPQIKVNLARRKLHGNHPVPILLDELQLNPHITACLPYYPTILPQVAFHLSKETILSPQDQAHALIQLATDGNILGRMFHGWSPWA